MATQLKLGDPSLLRYTYAVSLASRRQSVSPIGMDKPSTLIRLAGYSSSFTLAPKLSALDAIAEYLARILVWRASTAIREEERQFPSKSSELSHSAGRKIG